MRFEDQYNLAAARKPDSLYSTKRIDEFGQDLNSQDSSPNQIARRSRTPRSFPLKYGANNRASGEIETVEELPERSAQDFSRQRFIDDSPAFSGIATKSSRLGIRGMLFIFASVAILAGCFYYQFVSTYPDYQSVKANAFASVRWSGTSGEIKTSRLNYVNHGHYSKNGFYYEPEITFEYSIRGKSYKSHQISFPNPSFGWLTEGQQFIDNYAVGDSVKVFYDPSNPANCCLITGVTPALTKTFYWRIEEDNHTGTGTRSGKSDD